MDLKPWDPWEELERVRAEAEGHFRGVLDRLRQVVPGRPIAFVPDMDVVEAEGQYLLYLALPGMLEEDIDISLEGDVVVIRGERESAFDPANVRVHQAQLTHGYFERRVQFPEKIDGDGVQGSYEAGMLTIMVPKAAGPGSGSRGGST